MANIDTSTIAEQDFMAYVERLAAAVRHADRQEPLRAYLEGLLLPGERKSVEPMAAKVDPRNVGARHQSMHHFVAKATWDAEAVIKVARDHALAEFTDHGGVQAWIVDDTAFPKKGKFSVGVARQYCGVRGKEENCQAAVSISLANESMSVPAAYRLYLPETWTNDRDRCRTAGVPDDVLFQAKWEIALSQVDALLADRVPTAPIVADAGYGRGSPFRDGLRERGLQYVVGIPENLTVWPEGTGPLPPKPGTKATLLRRSPEHQPIAVADLARQLPDSEWRSVWYREGTKGDMRSRVALLRVRTSTRDYWRTVPRPVEWLLIEWPSTEDKPKFWLSSLDASIGLSDLLRLAHLRWRVERDYQELKQELGLGHFEGRGWLGFHHHGALCIAAYAFLIAERARLSPPEPLAFIQAPPRPRGFRPRTSPASS
jgi:SRSO17 transposase